LTAFDSFPALTYSRRTKNWRKPLLRLSTPSTWQAFMLRDFPAAKARYVHKKNPVLLLALIAGLSAAVSSANAARVTRQKSPLRAEAVQGTTLLGSYLAGHVARNERDNESAALYYRRALLKDPNNEDILDEAFRLELAAGEFDAARALAERLVKRQQDNLNAHIFLGVDAYRRRDYGLADEHFKAAQRSASQDDPALKLARAWVLIASGRADKALATLKPSGRTGWEMLFETVQRAFMADLARKKTEAEEAYKQIFDPKAPNTRITEAYARHLAVFGTPKQAKAVLEETGAAATPVGQQLIDEIKAGKTPKLIVSNAEEGLAEVFLGLGQKLTAQNGLDEAQVYFRVALYINPASDIAKLELGELYGNLEQYQKAMTVIEKVRETSPYWLNAQIRKSLYLNALQKPDDAIALVTKLLEKHPDDQQILQTAAAIESARKKYDAAIPYYSRSIALIGKPSKKDWQLYYLRGVAYERTKQWPKAEPDFKEALALDPDQAAVLNYLGYSWLDQNLNIPEAFDLIKKAVSLRKSDGYIIDSLGWAYYLQKDYEQAVKHLDKAVELRPEDPTLNDHLGDVYWRLGRKLEAKFQWTQALTLNPEPDDAAKIKKKLENGLPDDSGPHAGLERSAEPTPEGDGKPAAGAPSQATP
jgi:tetratricopeptide (TPR) repeat protein